VVVLDRIHRVSQGALACAWRPSACNHAVIAAHLVEGLGSGFISGVVAAAVDRSPVAPGPAPARRGAVT